MTSEFLYAGTFRRAHRADPSDVAFGIYGFRRDTLSGSLQHLAMTEIMQPGWLAIHPNGKLLYAASETMEFAGAPGGAVSAFTIDPATGGLCFLNSRRTPAMPCHCEVDATGNFLLVATFAGGTVNLFPLGEDGSIDAQADYHVHSGSSVHPKRQQSPHAHAVTIAPDNRFVLAPDLGTDEIVVYELDLNAGRLRPRPDRTVRVAPGSGPRHAVFDGTGSFVYLISEMSGFITVYSYDADTGSLRELQHLDLFPPGFAGLRSGGEICIHPSGRYLYATTRSHGSSGRPPAPGLDQLVWFGINPHSGSLELLGSTDSGGGIPRSFVIDASGENLYVSHQCSGNIVRFRIDLENGIPMATGESIATPAPVCLQLVSLR